MISELSKFYHGNSWDAQRLDGAFHTEFVEYATVVIGIYAAAAGLSRMEILNAENVIAFFSHYTTKQDMDDTYTYLRKSNVQSTDLGYELYQSGRIGAASKLQDGK